MVKNTKVGYKKPPSASQWKPGQSGNPSGKKKVCQEPPQPLLEMLNTQLYSPETVTIDGKKQPMSSAALLVRTIIRNAINAPLALQIKVLRMLKDLGILDNQHLPSQDEEHFSPFSEEERRYLANLNEEIREAVAAEELLYASSENPTTDMA